MIIIDNQGLFIYINIGYPRSYHDVTILWHSNLYANWHNHFTHMDEYFEHLVGYPSYMGEKMFIMWLIGQHELILNTDLGTMKAYNKMHVRYRVKPEWGIGGFKSKWQRLMKRFDYAKPKSRHLFHDATLLTFFCRGKEWKNKREKLQTCLQKVSFHFGVWILLLDFFNFPFWKIKFDFCNLKILE